MDRESERETERGLFTGVNLLDVNAGATRDLAAPLEAALAVPLDLHVLPGLTPLAAHQITPVHPVRGYVTLPAVRPQRARFRVHLAKVVRIFRVHQIPLRGQLDRRVVRHEAVAVVARDHLRSAVKVFLEASGHLRERGHLHPAGAHRARAGQAVALALHPHELLDGLGEGKG